MKVVTSEELMNYLFEHGGVSIDDRAWIRNSYNDPRFIKALKAQLAECQKDRLDRSDRASISSPEAKLEKEIDRLLSSHLGITTKWGVAGYERNLLKNELLLLIPDNLTSDIKDCLDCAREAIVDAICCEDGLDGGAGKKVIERITDILGDYSEWIKTHSEVE